MFKWLILISGQWSHLSVWKWKVTSAGVWAAKNISNHFPTLELLLPSENRWLKHHQVLLGAAACFKSCDWLHLLNNWWTNQKYFTPFLLKNKAIKMSSFYFAFQSHFKDYGLNYFKTYSFICIEVNPIPVRWVQKMYPSMYSILWRLQPCHFYFIFFQVSKFYIVQWRQVPKLHQSGGFVTVPE